MPVDEDRLMALRMVPMLFKDLEFVRQRATKPDAAEFAVVALSTDPYWDVVEKTRRYPGWVIVFSVTPPPGGNGQANVDIREFLPKQPQPGEVRDPNLTIGRAMDMFKRADELGIDLFEREPSVAGAFAKQRAAVG